VTSTETAQAPAPARVRSRIDRLYAAVPLASVYVWLCLLYAWESTRHSTPWLFTDELQLTQISRSIWETGHAARRGQPVSFGFQTLYAYLIAPAWSLHSVHAAYTLIKYVGVLTMTAVVFPAYLLARLVVSPRPALFAAAGAAAVPALAYAPMLVEEPLAYPWATLCVFLVVKALSTRGPVLGESGWWTRLGAQLGHFGWLRWLAFLVFLRALHSERGRWILAAATATVLAPLIRHELGVLILAVVFAVLALAWTSEPARRWREGWSAMDWVGAVVLGIGALVLGSAVIGAHSHSWLISTGYYRDRMLDYGLWAGASLAIGLGVLPVVAGLAALFPPPGERRTPELRAFTAVVVSSIVCFGVYAAVKATYISTVFATRVEERNLIYLAPLFFAATALWLERRRLRSLPLAAAGGLLLLLVLVANYGVVSFHLYSDALGMSILEMANRNLAFTPGIAKWTMLAVLGVSLLLLLSPALLRRFRLPAGGAVALSALLVLAWNITGQISAGLASNESSRDLLKNFPSPPNWVDRVTRGQPALYLGQQISDPNGIWQIEFWNKSLRYVWSLDGTAIRAGAPTLTPDLSGPSGALSPDPHVPYAIAEPGVDLVGRIVAQRSRWRLYRLIQPLRLEHAATGIFSDGWTGATSGYSQYHTPGERPGYAIVSVSRTAWHGPDKPGRVTIKVGRLVVGSDKQPHLGGVTAVRTWVVHSGGERTFYVPTPRPPIRVEVSISPTFSPSDYFASSDNRQLGAQIFYGFALKPPSGKPRTGR
jgi:hypothetical protein